MKYVLKTTLQTHVQSFNFGVTQNVNDNLKEKATQVSTIER